jgi:putative endonuclease
MNASQQRGRWGESTAARFLRRKGYRILHRNWRHGRGELDLVSRDGDVLVFVEVKTRSVYDPVGGYASAVAGRKAATIRRTAAAFLEREGMGFAHHRYDVVEVLTPPRCLAAEKISHWEGVSQGRG